MLYKELNLAYKSPMQVINNEEREKGQKKKIILKKRNVYAGRKCLIYCVLMFYERKEVF